MTPTAATALPDLDHELVATRRVLERVPDDALDWRPHEKSRTLAELATHLVSVQAFGTGLLTAEGFWFEDYVEFPTPKSRAALLDRWDGVAAQFREAAEASDLPASRYADVRRYVLGHNGHHRGQLTVYLRLLDVPLPKVYGPTADES